MQVTLRHSAVLIPIALLLALLLHFILPTAHAHAHAAYDTSVPAANSTVKAAPPQVVIHFKQAIKPDSVKIAIYDNKGAVVSMGDAAVSTSDPKTATVPMTGNDSDVYRVDWQNVSQQDNDPDIGAFVFGVSPSGSVDKVAAPDTTTSTSTSDGSSPLGIVLGLLGGLIVGAGGAYYFLKMRPAA